MKKKMLQKTILSLKKEVLKQFDTVMGKGGGATGFCTSGACTLETDLTCNTVVKSCFGICNFKAR